MNDKKEKKYNQKTKPGKTYTMPSGITVRRVQVGSLDAHRDQYGQLVASRDTPLVLVKRFAGNNFFGKPFLIAERILLDD